MVCLQKNTSIVTTSYWLAIKLWLNVVLHFSKVAKFLRLLGLNRQFLVSFLSLVSGSTGQWRPQLQTLLLLATQASARISGFPVSGRDQSGCRKRRGRWRHQGERQILAEPRSTSDVRLRRLQLVKKNLARKKLGDMKSVRMLKVRIHKILLFLKKTMKICKLV